MSLLYSFQSARPAKPLRLIRHSALPQAKLTPCNSLPTGRADGQLHIRVHPHGRPPRDDRGSQSPAAPALRPPLRPRSRSVESGVPSRFSK